MRLQLKTWPEIETYLKTQDAILIPIGSTEQHGPNGLIGTDAITAEAVAQKVGEAMGLMVAPTIAVGMAQHHLGFPGSMTLRPSTLIAVVRDMVQSLARHGFRRFYFVNGHGGNVASLTAAFSEIYAEASLAPAAGPGAASADNRGGLKCRLKNWYLGPEISALSKELYGNAEGGHATPSEVSLTWHLFPEAAKPMVFDPPIAPTGEFHDAADYRRRFPDGRIGSNPGLSSVADGARVLAAAVAGVSADLKRWLTEG